MSRAHLVVDGSNIATEGRTAPSLVQLDEAVRSFIAQQGYDNVTVIVDATFGHRIDTTERDTFEAAVLAGEMVTPPAGTIGRGDAFILQVARQADADVLSNDSFQELHAEHPWLFEPGRLWGGKPVPAVGWVFVPRAPVRGVTSRRAVQAAKKAAATTALAAAPAKKAAKAAKAAKTTKKAAPKKSAAVAVPDDVVTAGDVSVATNELTTTSRRRRRRGGGGGGGGGGGDTRPAVNEQAAYAMFVIDHPVGSRVSGAVDRFSSHGAYVALDGGAVGYVALKSLGDPPPRSAREVLTLGEQRSFTVARFDPTTRGIDVVPIDVDALTTSRADDTQSRRVEAVAARAAAESSATDAEEAPVSPAKKAAKKKAPARKKVAAKRAPAKKKATAKKAPARKAPAKKKAAAKRAPAKKKATAKKAPAKKKATAKKAPARKKATAKRAPAKRKASAKKAAAKKR